MPGALKTALLAAVASSIATWGVTRLARRMAVLDRPGGYKGHTVPMPLLGGVGVAVGAVAAILPLLRLANRSDLVRLAALGLGAAIILLAGLLDDVRGLGPRYKFIWQVGAASSAGVCLVALGVHLDLFLEWPPLPISLLTALWIVAITNAINFLDNMDGLCAGVGVIGAGALAALNAHQGEPLVALAAAALGGACLGFLPHNWPRARVFLGDAGAMFIGFLLAALSVMGVYTRGARAPVLAVLAPLCVLGLPVLDAVLVVILRMRDHRAPWIGDRRHISHRLVRRGLRPATAVTILWLASAACGLVGVLLPLVNTGVGVLLFAVLFCALAVLCAAAGTRGLHDSADTVG